MCYFIVSYKFKLLLPKHAMCQALNALNHIVCICIYVCACVCVCVCVCVYTYTYTHTHIYVCMHICSFSLFYCIVVYDFQKPQMNLTHIQQPLMHIATNEYYINIITLATMCTLNWVWLIKAPKLLFEKKCLCAVP